MSLFRLSNHLFALGLDAQELSVYAYLCSLPASGFTLQGAAVISVKQRTIAANYGIRSPVTVAKTIDRLRKRGWSIIWNVAEKRTGITVHTAMQSTNNQLKRASLRFVAVCSGYSRRIRCSLYLFLCKSFSAVPLYKFIRKWYNSRKSKGA